MVDAVGGQATIAGNEVCFNQHNVMQKIASGDLLDGLLMWSEVIVKNQSTIYRVGKRSPWC